MASSKLKVPILLEWSDIEAYMEQHDIVKVVRCADCKHNTKLFNDQGRVQFGDGVCPCKRAGGDPYIDWDPDPDWFCADGEKVTE